MKYIKRYSSLVLALVLSLSIAVVPAHAATATSKTTFWGALAMAADNALESYFGLDTDGLFQKVVGLVSDNVCSDSPDGKHHGEVVRGHLTSDGKYSGGFGGGSRANHYVVHCTYCGDYFELSDAVLDTAYQEHVAELPAPAVTSEGNLYWSPSHSYIENVAGYSVNGGCAHSSYNGTAYASVTCNDSLHTFLITATNAESTFRSSSISFGYSGIAPVDGTYSIVNGAAWVASVDGSDASDTWTTSDFLSRHYSSGSAVSIVKNGSMGGSWYSSINGTYYAPTLQVVPDSSLLNSGGYVTDSRTTNYNFELGDSTTVFNNVSNVFNETNNTYYNPITNNSYTVNNWSYDYSDRSYTVNYTTVDESETTIDPLFLNTILTCRHYYISLYYTAQRFGHVDALLRQVTSYVVECDKLWRFQRQNYFDAWDLENASSTQLIKPFRRGCWFVKDKDYNAYNTLACVGNLKKSMQEGDMMTDAEILALQQNTQDSNMDGVVNPSRRWLRKRKAAK